MAQPPDLAIHELKKMTRTRDLRITNLQRKNEKLKGEIEECQAKMRKCVCVCACPPVMRGDTVKHALTSTRPPPNDIPSIPWSPVVLPLWTPWGAC